MLPLAICRSVGLTDSMPSICERASNALRMSCGEALGRSRAIATIAFFAERNSMYDGMTFMPKSATTARRISTTLSPIRLTPSCLPFMLMVPSPVCLLERPEPPQLVQVQPDEEGLADDVLVGHEAPDAAVARVVAVVAHHEVVAWRHGARHAFHIVVAIGGVRKRPRRRDHRRRVLVDQDLVVDRAEGLDVAARELHALFRQVVVDLAFRHLRAVDPQIGRA